MSWLADTMVWTGALIAVVLVLRRPVARAFGPGMAYALWALPLLRLVLPPIVLPALPAAPVARAAAPEVVVINLPPAAPAAVPAFDWAALGLALWLGGAAALLGWRLLAYWRMRRRLLAGAVPLERRGAVRVVESAALASPVAFGLIDKVVAMPAELAGGDAGARDLALAHELEHHRRRDLWANWAAQPLLALHWFNPLAWAGWRAMRRDQEAACDAAVLAGRDGATRAAYGSLIAALAGAGPEPLAAALACPMLGEKSIIHRLRSLTMSEPSIHRRWLGRALLAGAALALPLTASISRAQSAPPAPPAAPEAPVAAAAPNAPNAPAAPAAPDAPAVPAAPAAPALSIAAPAVGEKKVVIVQREIHGSAGAGHTVTIQRGGKTYVFTTDKELTPAEVDARIAKIEAEMARMPGPGGERHATVIVKQHGDGAGSHEMRKMVIKDSDIDGTIASAFAEADGEIAKAVGEACGSAGATQVSAASDDGARRVRIRTCQDGIRAHVAEALKKARTEIAANSDMPADIKAKVLKALDEKIAAQK